MIKKKCNKHKGKSIAIIKRTTNDTYLSTGCHVLETIPLAGFRIKIILIYDCAAKTRPFFDEPLKRASI